MALVDCENLTDEDLAERVLAEPDFYRCLVERFEASLKRYILRLSNVAYEEAEDILQNVFLKAYLNLNDFDKGLKFSSWIYRIAHNEVVSNFRKISARPQADATMSEEWERIAGDFSLEFEIDKRLDIEKLELVLSKLDERYREILILKFLEQKDYNEIADILKKPLGTIATLISRAKRQFREQALKEKIDF